MNKLLFLFLILSSTLFSNEPHPQRYEGLPKYKKYQYRPLSLIKKFISKDPIIFEAGGHYGEDSISFSKTWPNSTIVTFEPNPHAFEKMLEAVKTFQNIYPYNLAVNDYEGKAILNVCYGTNGDEDIFEGASSLLEPSEGMEIHYQGPKVEVDCVILDKWCSENNIDHFDFLWLDLEGLELQVLKSSPNLLKKAKIIFTETNIYNFRIGTTKYSDLKSFLEQNGFTMIAHWYMEDIQGNAVFINNRFN